MRVKFDGDSSYHSGTDYNSGGHTGISEFILYSQNNATALVTERAALDIRDDGNDEYPLTEKSEMNRVDSAGEETFSGGVVVSSKGKITELRFAGLNTNATAHPTGDGTVKIYGRNL